MIKDYQVSKEELADRQMRLTISVSNEALEPELRKIARRIAKNVSVPGFRKGRAPYNVLLAHYGREALVEEWYEKEGEELFKQVLEKEEIEPYRAPVLEDLSWSPFKLVVLIPEEPVVKLPDYRAMHVEKPEVADVDALVEEQLEAWREKYAIWKDVDRPVESKDKVTFDFKLHSGDEVLVDQADMVKELNEDGEESFVPQLTENLLGMTPGESKSYTLHLTDEDDLPWTGDVTIDLTVKKIQEHQPVQLSEEIVANIVADERLSEEIKTEDDLRNFLRPIIQKSEEDKARNTYFDQILKALDEHSEVSFPPALAEERVNSKINELKERLAEINYSWENYLKTAQTTEETLREAYRSDAERMTRYGLILGKVIDQEDLDIEPEDIDAEIERILEKMDPLMRETSRKLYESEKQRDEIGLKLLNDRVQRFLEAIFSGEEETTEPATETSTEPPAEEKEDTSAAQPETGSEAETSEEAEEA